MHTAPEACLLYATRVVFFSYMVHYLHLYSTATNWTFSKPVLVTYVIRSSADVTFVSYILS